MYIDRINRLTGFARRYEFSWHSRITQKEPKMNVCLQLCCTSKQKNGCFRTFSCKH